MTEYLNMWRNFANFSGRTNRRGFWMACLFNLFAFLAILLAAFIIPPFIVFQFLYAAAVIIPELSLTVRRLRDVGRAWYYIFLPFIPVVGTIILIVLLCKQSSPSAADAGVELV